MDHVVQLEVDVKTSFTKKKTTVAVFLDISKAYDCVWIQGLLYKLASVKVSGHMLRWIREFLNGRKISVRVDKALFWRKICRS